VTVCTLFEGDYHYGVAALVNSLYSRGFRGKIYAGYRGPLPDWVHQSGNGTKIVFAIRDDLEIRFIKVDTERHLTNHKPEFMRRLWRDESDITDSLLYFDPDITVRCRSSFFEEWLQDGVAVCQDVNGTMPNMHPVRNAWRRELHQLGIECRNNLDTYFNAGFVGLRRTHSDFLGLWCRILDHMESKGYKLSGFVTHERTEPFSCVDQDALNIACMAYSPLCPMGQDGMDFQWGGGGYVMNHAIGNAKPWRKKMLRTLLLKGVPPSRADKAFYNNVQGLIQPYSTPAFLVKRSIVRLSSALGRFCS
jgi:hypothetical protein